MRRFPKRIIKPVGSVLVLGVLYALAIQPALDFIPSLNITIINLGLIAAVVVLTISVSIAVITLVQKLGSWVLLTYRVLAHDLLGVNCRVLDVKI